MAVNLYYVKDKMYVQFANGEVSKIFQIKQLVNDTFIINFFTADWVGVCLYSVNGRCVQFGGLDNIKDFNIVAVLN